VIAARAALAGLFLIVGVLVQTVVFSPMRLPGAEPDVVLVVVVAFAVATDSATGSVVGFVGGLLLDLVPPADGTVGRWALVLMLAGWLAGKYRLTAERGVLSPLFVVATIAPAALLGYAGLGLLLGDPRVTGSGIASSVPYATFYDVVLSPFVVPAVGALVRRTRRATGPAASRW
jgi:rod shape-determining protein MreD